MKFYRLSPDTVGSLGDKTIHGDWEDRPLKISKLQIDMDFWPDDDLVEANIYGFAGTHRLAEAIRKSGLTGVEFDHVDIEEGDQFWIHKRKHPNESVPELLWFKFIGRAGVDDFGLIQGPGSFPLVVSEKALVLLRSFSFKGCEVKEYNSVEAGSAG